jgi:4-hydroxybenzoate polyprenyltransferase
LDFPYLIAAVLAFLSFSLAASSIYCFNDIYDVKADRLHPKKCKRPIASGAISIPTGYAIMFTTLCLSLYILWQGQTLLLGNFPLVCSILIFYYIMNIAYCIKLKQTAIVDIFLISVGFVLRILMGGFCTGIYITHWIVLITFLLALFLAIAKRRDDVLIFINTGVKARKNIEKYNLQFMNSAMSVVASITMVCYILYTVSEDVVTRLDCQYVYITSFFVLAGILRYLQVTVVDANSGSPTKILLKFTGYTHIIERGCKIGWKTFYYSPYSRKTGKGDVASTR